MASQMSGGGMTLAKTLLYFLGKKGNVKQFYELERVVADSQRTAFEATKDKALTEEIELAIKHGFNGNRPNGTIPLIISYGK